MTTDRDFDRLVAAWLDLMPDRAPDSVVTAILEDVALEPQVRRPRIRLPEVPPLTGRLLLVAATILLVASLIGGAALIAGGRLPTFETLPVAPSPASAAPSVTPPSPASGPVAEPLRATWTAMVPGMPALGTANSPARLVIDEPGTSTAVRNIGPSATFHSTAVQAGDQLRLILDLDGGGCASGATGTYRMVPSADGSSLTLVVVHDDCTTRADVLGRTWLRSLTASSSVGAGIVDGFDPAFMVTMPDEAYEPRVLTDYVEIAGPVHDLQAWKNPQGFASACSQDARYPYTPGAAAFAAYFAQNDAFTVVENTPMTIDGHPAIHLVVRARKDYAPCPGQDLMTWTPKDLAGHWILTPGELDSVYLVDLGSDTVMFEYSPIGSTASEKPVIDSIRIPATLPEH